MTANQISREAYSTLASRMQSDMIAAQDAAAVNAVPNVADILHNWTFEPYAPGTFYFADGTIKTRAARLSCPFRVGTVFIVSQDAVTGEYSAECPAFRQHWGARVIEAMVAKVAADKAKRAN